MGYLAMYISGDSFNPIIIINDNNSFTQREIIIQERRGLSATSESHLSCV